MTIKNILSRLVSCLTVAFVSLATAPLFGDTFGGNVNVRVLETITLVENQQINFGVILNEAGTCTMDATGNTTGDIFSCVGNETLGIFTVNGSSNTTVNVSVASGTANNITFAPTLPNGNTVVLTGAGASSSAQVIVAGTLTVGVGAVNGVTQIPYTLTADYD